MTKDTYYDMCEQMGTNPEDGDIPAAYDDLSNQTKDALVLFEYLTDKWDSTNGTYLGKDLSSLKIMLDILDLDYANWLIIVELLMYIVSMKVKSINDKVKRQTKRKK